VSNPNVIHGGDPEPDRDTEWRDAQGDVWYWDEEESRWTCDARDGEWFQLRHIYFPMVRAS
jgi:hypothetical protein